MCELELRMISFHSIYFSEFYISSTYIRPPIPSLQIPHGLSFSQFFQDYFLYCSSKIHCAILIETAHTLKDSLYPDEATTKFLMSENLVSSIFYLNLLFYTNQSLCVFETFQWKEKYKFKINILFEPTISQIIGKQREQSP